MRNLRQILKQTVMKKVSFLILLFSLFITTAFSQEKVTLNGIVKDADTKKGLPFATVKTENGASTIADVDGKFYFSLASKEYNT